MATFEVFLTYFLGEVVSRDFKDYDVKVFEFGPGSLEEAVSTRKADIGITYLPVPHRELDILRVSTVEMGIFGSKKFLDKEFEELPFVVPISRIHGTPSKVNGLDGWPEHLIHRRVKYRVSLMETALDLCRRVLCVGYLPKFVVDIHNS